MKRIAKRIVPQGIQRRMREKRRRRALRREFEADSRRYTGSAALAEGALPGLTGIQLEAQLTRDYHRVEKGLALRRPKRPFGAEVAARIDALLPEAHTQAPDAVFVEAAASARTGLEAWNGGGAADPTLAPAPRERVDLPDPRRFFESRHSVRDFAAE